MAIAVERTTPCRGCGKRVMFVRTKDGSVVPLDVVAPTYTRVHDPETGKGVWVRDTTEETFVSHFATCSKANQFSGQNTRRRTS